MVLPTELFEELIGSEGVRVELRGHERRQAKRVPVSLRGSLLRLSGAPGAKPEATKVREISRAGAGLLHSLPLGAGDTIVLAMKTLRGTPVRVVGQVVRCQPVGPVLFHVGAKFLRLVDVPPAPPARPAAGAPEAAVAPEVADEVERVRRAICS